MKNTTKLVTKSMPSPVGTLRLVANDSGLMAVIFEKSRTAKTAPAGSVPVKKHPMLDRAEKQLREYFAGTRTRFDVPLAAAGTPFQKKVWQGLATIPFGATFSYMELARKIKAPKAARAVGGANGRNPLPIIVPCHRVIAASGKMGGFSGGLGIKAFLLKHEGIKIAA